MSSVIEKQGYIQVDDHLGGDAEEVLDPEYSPDGTFSTMEVGLGLDTVADERNTIILEQHEVPLYKGANGTFVERGRIITTDGVVKHCIFKLTPCPTCFYSEEDEGTETDKKFTAQSSEQATRVVAQERFILQTHVQNRLRLHGAPVPEIYQTGFIYVGFEKKPYYYIAMEEIPGVSLHKFTIESMKDLAEVTSQILAFLKICSDCKITLRDLKPENIMAIRNPSGRPMLTFLDFGTVRDRHNNASDQLTKPASSADIPHTMRYAAPELNCHHTPADVPPNDQGIVNEAYINDYDAMIGPPTDLYAAGVILYELISGDSPFVNDGENIAEMGDMAIMINRVVRPIDFDKVGMIYFRRSLLARLTWGKMKGVQISPLLTAFIKKCLQLHPNDRFQTPSQAIDFLSAWFTTTGVNDDVRQIIESPLRETAA